MRGLSRWVMSMRGFIQMGYVHEGFYPDGLCP